MPIFTKFITELMTDDEQIYMLLAYPKNVQDNLTDAQLKKLKQIVERWSE
ncbi:hypothetical protein [Planctobacterium marinum]|nr:hypothetical protein [Planctobacterium marinum]MCC2604821.1 hypothetical protein [Planctobacterium marinum]